MQRFKITKEGYGKLKDDLNHLLTVERPAIAKAIGAARELGDLSENEEYATALDKQKVIEAMISDLSDKLSNAEVVDIKSFSGDTVNFGAKVKLLDLNTEKEVTYQLLSEFESDIGKGILAIESLVGKALVGKKKGDEVEIKTPAGVREFEILEVIY